MKEKFRFSVYCKPGCPDRYTYRVIERDGVLVIQQHYTNQRKWGDAFQPYVTFKDMNQLFHSSYFRCLFTNY